MFVFDAVTKVILVNRCDNSLFSVDGLYGTMEKRVVQFSVLATPNKNLIILAITEFTIN